MRQFWRAPSILVEFMELWVRTGRPSMSPAFRFSLLESKLGKVCFVKMALERLSCHKDFKITQMQTKVSFFYFSPWLQVEFRAIFEPFSYILLNGAMLSRMQITNNVWAACASINSISTDFWTKTLSFWLEAAAIFKKLTGLTRASKKIMILFRNWPKNCNFLHYFRRFTSCPPF